jgi:hypothetical protein
LNIRNGLAAPAKSFWLYDAVAADQWSNWIVKPAGVLWLNAKHMTPVDYRTCMVIGTASGNVKV